MADRLQQLTAKYQSVLNFIRNENIQLQNVNLQDNKLLIRATAPSQDAKNRVWDQIKLVDPNYSADLIADIHAPATQAAAAGGGGRVSSAGSGERSYTVKPGDNLSKISKQ